MPPEKGSLHDRLTALLEAWAEHIAEAPALLSAMNWLALGRDLDQLPDRADSNEVRTLRERIASSTRRRSTPSSTARRRPPNSASPTGRPR